MRKLILSLAIICFLVVPALSQTTEDACKTAGDYWSEGLKRCFVVSDMKGDLVLLLNEIRSLEAQKVNLQKEQQEYNQANKNKRKKDFDDQIAKFEANHDATADQAVADFWQKKVEQFEAKRKYHDEDVDVSNHGQLISDLSSKIGKYKEELDHLLTQ